MFQSGASVPTGHKAYVHDTQVDQHGRLLATCSSDRSVVVYDVSPDGNNRTEVCRRTNLDGNVTRISWAHPKYGGILAAACSDKVVRLFQLSTEGDELSTTLAALDNIHESDVISSVAFHPRFMRIATGSADGAVRLYDCEGLAKEVGKIAPADSTGNRLAATARNGVTSLAWCPTQTQSTLTIAVGFDDGSVRVWTFDESARRWDEVVFDIVDGGAANLVHSSGVLAVAWAPWMGRLHHYLASSGMDGVLVRRMEVVSATEYRVRASVVAGLRLPQWSLSWNAAGTAFVSVSDDGTISVTKRLNAQHYSAGTWKGDAAPSVNDLAYGEGDKWVVVSQNQ